MAELSRTERRRQQTHQALLQAGYELIGEFGVSEWPISDLADRADVALGSFYNHFADRDEIINELVKERVLESHDRFVASRLPNADMPTRLAHRIAYLVDLAVSDRAHRRFTVAVGLGGDLYRPDINTQFGANMNNALGEGLIDAGDLTFTLSALRGLMLSTYRHIDWMVNNRPDAMDVPQLRREAVRMALGIAGVPADRARELVASVDDIEPVSSEDLVASA